ncbi:MAG: hypothetical protein ACJA1U_002159 [Bermanella sp.]
MSKQYDSQFFDDDDEFNDVIEDADDD